MKFTSEIEAIDVSKGKIPLETEYILTYNIPDLEDNASLTKRGTIVTNVEKREDGNYDYIVKSSGKKQKLYHPWAFVENTSENFEKLKKCWEYLDNIEKFKILLKQEWDKLDTLRSK